MRKLITILVAVLFISNSCAIKQPENKKILEIPQIISGLDKDNDKIDDYSDIVQSARSQIDVVTKYDTDYYQNAFPSEDSGACADVIWRALNGAGYNFKEMIDDDIKNNPNLYPQNPIQDQNINFRRVNNIKIFLERNAEVLNTEAVSWDKVSLQNWNGGDIVTYEQIPGGLWHVAIISDKRRDDGIPLLIHNYGHGVKEDDYLLNWPTKISGHYRLSKNLIKSF